MYYREPVAGPFGHSFSLVFKGTYYGAVAELTRSTFYSGDEMLNNSKVWMLKPGVRIVFNTKERFDVEKVEFHFDGEVYVPRDSAVRLGGTRNIKYSYNCNLQTERDTV